MTLRNEVILWLYVVVGEMLAILFWPQKVQADAYIKNIY